MALHANFLSIGSPDASQFQDNCINAFSRVFFECLSIVAVNVFVLISGWYGIKVNWKKFCSFIFQCLFFSLGLYVIKIVFGHTHQSFDSIFQFFVSGISMKKYWFVISYIGLYILSPVLNSFINSGGGSKNEHRIFVISFFVFEFVYGFLLDVEFRHGYSCIHLVGMYMLGRYLRLYANKLKKMSFGKLFLLYVIFALTDTFFVIIGVFDVVSLNPKIDWIFNCDSIAYTNPIVILSSVFLLLAFSKLELRNGVINYIASSSLAAYLFHLHPVIFPFYKNYVLTIYDNHNGFFSVILILCFILLVFFISVVLDKLRKLVWDLFFAVFQIKTDFSRVEAEQV